MKLLLAVFAVLAAGASSSVLAQDYPLKTLQPQSIICFSYGDWKEMVSASIDNDAAAASRLVQSGAGRVVPGATKVAYLDKAAGNLGGLIQMPSGKAAYTSDKFLK